MRSSVALLTVLLTAGLGLSSSARGQRNHTPVPAAPSAIQSDVSDAFVYVPGTIGNLPGTSQLPDGVEAQVRQALENIRATLAAAGTDLAHVVSANVFLSDTRHFAAMNAVYRTYFPDDPPTRATVGVDLPVPGALVQISMVAVKPDIERRAITPQGMLTPGLPYSWGVLTENTLFIAGATSRNPDTYEPVTGDMATQTRQVMENIGAVLRAANMDYADVTSCKVFLDDPREFQAMNQVYGSFFTDEPPARATIRAGLMNSIFRSEIQCVAVRDATRRRVVPVGVAPSRSPLSPAIRVGTRLYLSGMVGRGASGYAPGDVEAQTRQALENLRATLAAAEMDFADVVDVTVFVADIRHSAAVAELVRAVLPTNGPRATMVGSALMSPDALVEIMMTAAR
jgi:2-iminobutanoate/2-iminopropanoate deaminase